MRLWSAETPYLYTLVLCLVEGRRGETEVEWESCRLGAISPLYLPYISPASPLYLPYISQGADALRMLKTRLDRHFEDVD